MASTLHPNAQRGGKHCPHCDETLTSQTAYDTHISHYHPPKSAEIQGQSQGSWADDSARGHSSAPNTPVGHLVPASSQAKLSASTYVPPTQTPSATQPPTPTTPNPFKVVYRTSTGVRSFLIPFDESYDAFLARLGHVERTAMRYALVNHRGVRESAERLLSGGLLYQMMVSELVKRKEMWGHAVVWECRGDGGGEGEGEGGGDGF